MTTQLFSEEDRVQYKDANSDYAKASDVSGEALVISEELDLAIDEYFNAVVTEAAPEAIASARRVVVSMLADLQFASAKLAYVLRVDLNEAVERLSQAKITGGSANMEGL